MKAQLIKLNDGKFVVVNRETLTPAMGRWMINENNQIYQINSVKAIPNNHSNIIAGHDPLPAISNIDKVFEMWKEATDEKEAKKFSQSEIDKALKDLFYSFLNPDDCLGDKDKLIFSFLAARKDYYSVEMIENFSEWKQQNFWWKSTDNRYLKTLGMWTNKVNGDFDPKDGLNFNQLFHLYQLSLLPEVLHIEWDENKNEIIKVII
jgi:hypothetical protein